MGTRKVPSTNRSSIRQEQYPELQSGRCFKVAPLSHAGLAQAMATSAFGPNATKKISESHVDSERLRRASLRSKQGPGSRSIEAEATGPFQ